ncbi:MAG: hypothetical protein LBM69_10690 [Lachnospiraceae bacterium]|nr:hypothetical protein [Lachnospiraceae bacterium]
MQGNVIPVPLMPMWLQNILNWLPFRYTSDLPFRIYSGNIVGMDALFQISIEILWVIALFMLGAWTFRRVLRRIVIQGG